MGRPKLLNREHVVDIALSEYWRNGIDNVGMAEIARLSGFDRAGIYKEFGGEEGLVNEVLETYSTKYWLPRMPVMNAVSSPVMLVKLIYDAFINDNVMKNLADYGVQDKTLKWPMPPKNVRGCCYFGLITSDTASGFKGSAKRKIKEITRFSHRYMREKFEQAERDGLLIDGVSVDAANAFYEDQCLLMQLMRQRGFAKTKITATRDFVLKSIFTQRALVAKLH